MCNGLRFETRGINERELELFYNLGEIRALKKKGLIEQHFWQAGSHLPIYTKTGRQLKVWGNKSDYLELPKTSWAKLESIKEGNWAHWHPKPVLITAQACLVGKAWLKLIDGLTGLMVRMDGQDIVYIVTRPADEQFKNLTSQDRQPIGNFIYGNK